MYSYGIQGIYSDDPYLFIASNSPLTINNLPVFADFLEARQYNESFSKSDIYIKIKKQQSQNIFDELFDDKSGILHV